MTANQSVAHGRTRTATPRRLIGADLTELLKAGGSVKCCTLELRDRRR
jgi:N-dimethylarginine dimethylaminohydrolase